MEPYSGHNLTRQQNIFNCRLLRARRCVECAFGILTTKWKRLKSELQLNAGNVDVIVKCNCLLHYMSIDNEGLSLENAMESVLLNNVTGSRWYNHYSKNASDVRKTFKNYFVSLVGDIQFQYNILLYTSFLFFSITVFLIQNHFC